VKVGDRVRVVYANFGPDTWFGREGRIEAVNEDFALPVVVRLDSNNVVNGLTIGFRANELELIEEVD
jgi:hypothetical protein